MSKGPDRLNIEESDRANYDNEALKEIFAAKDRKDQFLFTMALGFKSDVRTKLDKKDGFVRVEYLNSD